jgi:hypothetical protein
VVFLVRPGETRLRQHVIEASLRGHLHPIILWSGEVVANQYRGELVSDGEVRPITLGRYLAQIQVNELQLVSVRDDLESIKETSRAADEEAFSGWLERALKRVGSRTTRGVLVSVNKGTDIVAEMFSTLWDYNVLLDPFDAAGEEGFVGTDFSDQDNIDAAFASACLLTGAWRWLDTAASEGIRTNAALPQVEVRVMRSALRLVDAGDLAVRLTTEALEFNNSWPIPERTEVHPDPDRFIADVAGEISTHKDVAFQLRRFVEKSESSRVPTGIIAAIRLFFTQLVEEIVRMPGRWLRQLEERVVSRIEDELTRGTFGEDSKVLIRRGGKLRPSDFHASTTTRLAGALNLPELKPISPTPSPSTWRQLSAGVLGAVDGASISDTIEGRMSVTGVQKWIIRDRDFIAVSNDPNLHPLEVPMSELGIEDSDPDEKVRFRQYDALTCLRVRKYCETDISEDARASVLTKVDDFESTREKALLWRLSANLADAIVDAEEAWLKTGEDFEGYSAEVTEDMQSIGALQKHASRRVRLFIFMLAVMLVAMIVGFFFITAIVGLIALGLLVVTFFGSIVSFLRIAREQVRLRNKHSNASLRISNLIEARQHYYGEYVRLSSLYDQYLDWSEVLGSVALKPFGDSVVPANAEPYKPATELVSFVVGTPETDSQVWQGEKQKLRRNKVRPQWLYAVLTELLDLWRIDYAKVAGYAENMVPAPEADAGMSSVAESDGHELLSPRKDFRDRVLRGDYSTKLRVRVEEEMREVFKEGDPTQVLGRISTSIPGFEGRNAAEIVQPPVLMPTLPDFQDSIFYQVSSGGFGVESVTFGVSDQYRVMPAARDVETREIEITPVGNRFVLGGFRIDFSERTPISRLKTVKLDKALPSASRPPLEDFTGDEGDQPGGDF